MRDDFTWHPGEPAERGRLAPDDRPGGALPMNPLQAPSYASPYARVRWPAGALTCNEVGLESVAAGADPGATPVGEVASPLLPTVQPDALLADAVRVMIGSFLRRIAVVDDHEELVGFVTMSEAAARAERDPAVRDLLGELAFSPSVWARRFR